LYSAANFSAIVLSLLSFILYILGSFPFASGLNIKQSCITSMNENPLWLIAFVNVSTMCLISRAFVRAMNVAFAASAIFNGFIGLSKTPRGSDFEMNPCWDVGVGCPVVSEKD